MELARCVHELEHANEIIKQIHQQLSEQKQLSARLEDELARTNNFTSFTNKQILPSFIPSLISPSIANEPSTTVPLTSPTASADGGQPATATVVSDNVSLNVNTFGVGWNVNVYNVASLVVLNQCFSCIRSILWRLLFLQIRNGFCVVFVFVFFQVSIHWRMRVTQP